MKKIALVLLTVIFSVSFLIGCAPDTTDPIYYDAIYTPTTTPVETLTLSDGGETEYKIVIPENATEMVEYAGKELKLYFDKATGTNIQIVTDAGLTYADGDKYLSVGNTAIMTANSVTVDYSVTDRDGFIIKTKGNSYLMCGGGDYGTLYSVYEFLHRAFGWETYAADEIYFERVQKAEVEKLDVLDVPAFKNRTGGYFEGRTDAFFTAKLRTYADYGLGIFGQNLWGIWAHSHMRILSYGDYKSSTHPQFYGNKQICMTSDGIADAFADSLVKMIWNNPNQTFFMMGHEDNEAFCTCANCTAYDMKYNCFDDEGVDGKDGIFNRGRSVLMMQFFNEVCLKIKDLLPQKYETEYINALGENPEESAVNEAKAKATADSADRWSKIRLLTFAYGFTMQPPVEEKQGAYELIDAKKLTVEKTDGDTYDFIKEENVDEDNDGNPDLNPDETLKKQSVKYKIVEGASVSLQTATDNAVIMLCPLGKAFDYYHELFNAQYNPMGKYCIENWFKVSDRIIGYMYGNNFGTMAEWFDDFSSLPANYQFYASNGNAEWAFSENSSGVKGSVSFQALRSYVYSKLQWNPNLDLDDLIDDFMLNYYKVAAPYLKEYFEYCRMYYASKMHDAEISGLLDGKMNTSFTFGSTVNDYNTVLQMGNILSKALKAIENSSIYSEYEKTKLINRVKLESMTIRLKLIKDYAEKIPDSVYLELVDSFIEDSKALELYYSDPISVAEKGGYSDEQWDAQRLTWLTKKGIA